MTTETMLSVDELAQEIRRIDGDHSLGAGAMADALMPFIEQAVLQSPEVQALRKDAERLRVVLKEAAAELDCLGSEIDRIHRENPSIVTTLPASNVLSMARDAAMEQQP